MNNKENFSIKDKVTFKVISKKKKQSTDKKINNFQKQNNIDKKD